MNVTIEDIPDIHKGLETGDMNLAEIEISFDLIIEQSLAIVDQFIAADDPDKALAAFMVMSAFLSAAAAKKPMLVQKISTQAQNLKESAEKVGKKLKADSVSIEVGFHWGVSIDLSWDI